MSALITVDDIEIATGETITDLDQAEFWINAVSSFIEGYTHQIFGTEEDVTLRLRADGWGIIHFDNIVDVTSVKQFGTESTLPHWSWDGMSQIWGMQPYQVVDVVLSHGWGSVPEDIKAIAVTLCASALGIPLGSAGTVTKKRAGDVEESYSVGLSADGDPLISVSGLMAEALESYRPTEWSMRTGPSEPPINNIYPIF